LFRDSSPSRSRAHADLSGRSPGLHFALVFVPFWLFEPGCVPLDRVGPTYGNVLSGLLGSNVSQLLVDSGRSRPIFHAALSVYGPVGWPHGGTLPAGSCRINSKKNLAK